MPQIIANYFTRMDYVLALPIVMLTVFALGILLIDLMLPEEWKRLNAVTALMGIGFAAVALIKNIHLPYDALASEGMSLAPFWHGFGGAVRMDSFAIYFCYLFLAGAAITVLMSVRYLEIEGESHGEFYALILLSVIGMMGMAMGMDLIMLFISLELMAISTYVLVGFLRRDKRSNEASLKYLLLGAFSSGIFAYGLSLLYGLSGSTKLHVIAQKLGTELAREPHSPVVILALLTTSVGLFFKIAAVPFHQWAPDAYEGAPTSITGYMSVAGKAAAWALLLRIYLWGLPAVRPLYIPLLVFVAIATMTGGNLGALTQTNLKRLFAYSSIAHVGYMLLGLIAGDKYSPSGTGIKGILFYLMVYTFMNLGAFAVLTSLRRREIIGDEIDDISGLYFKAPAEAMLMFVFLLSLAGIPPFAGFYGKYFIFLSLIETGHYGLASIAVLYVAVAMYYYLRVANAMLMRPAVDAEPVHISPGMGVALAITAAATIGIGLFPEVFIRLTNWGIGITRVAPSVAQIVK
ncbi:MAG TPA: NADH-quinone oxidoreductase subunit N [Terriglobales bacterium]|nr:NADH-quinone oxidoreductase subunit N [Terriglobales bacterium]